MTARPPSPPSLVTPIGQSLASPPGCALSVLVGDCRAILRSLPSESVQCCVTSPPYFGLRDYGHGGQIGTESTPEDYVQSIVEVFDEVKRVLKDDGTLWLNIGDSYYNHRTGHNGGMPGQSVHNGKQNGKPDKAAGCARRATKLKDIQEKELIGIPWMVAFALRKAGWLIRQEIIWSKPNPTPEKVTDRFTRSHEQIFLLTKRPWYKCNVLSELEEAKDGTKRRKRSVWEVQTAKGTGAHFAMFPTDLITPCIRAATDRGDVVLDPFGGSGTTGKVALELGRRALLIELNPDYAKIIDQRTAITPGLALD